MVGMIRTAADISNLSVTTANALKSCKTEPACPIFIAAAHWELEYTAKEEIHVFA